MADKPQNPFVIDTARLDIEWARQPKLSRDCGTDEADAQHEYNRAKTNVAVHEAKLKATHARLYLSIRRDPEQFDLREKPTVDEVEAAVLIHTDYMTALQNVFEAMAEMNDRQRELDIAKAYTVAITHDRRKMLENYVQLLSMDYVCEREPRPLSENAKRTLRDRNRRTEFGEGTDSDE
jgi:hypothetical protein